MKKYLIILVLFIAAMTTRAQTSTFDLGTSTLYESTTAQTLTGTTAKWYQFNALGQVPISFTYSTLLTKGTSSDAVFTVTLYGKCFKGDAWTEISSATSSTITTTETVQINITNHLQYMYFKALLTPAGSGTTTVTNQKFKIWRQ